MKAVKLILTAFEFWGFVVILFNLFFLVVCIKNKKVNGITKSLFYIVIGVVAYHLKYLAPFVLSF